MRVLPIALLTAALPALAQETFDRLPEGAVEISEAEARAAIAEGRLVFAEPTGRAAEEAEEAARLAAYFERSPEARAAYEAAARTVPEGAHSVAIETRAGRRTVTLDGLARLRRDLGGSLRQVNEPDTALRTYEWLYGLASAAGLRLPTPEAAAGLGTERLRALNLEILNQYETFPRPAPQDHWLPAFPEADFDPSLLEQAICVGGQPANLGSGLGSDLQVFGAFEAKCGLEPDGILALDPRPYRHHLGCVKDQGNRGTCTSFAVASAMETAFSHASQQRLDLSEQALYAHAKLREPLADPDRNWDGLNTADTMARLAQGAVTVSFESGWDYNPSHQRTSVASPTPVKYQNSCDGYSQTCSDYVHQAKQVCYRPTGQWRLACGFETQASTWGLRLDSPGLQLWDAETPNASVQAIKAALDSGHQVVISLMVNEPFSAGVAGDGFVDYDGEDVSAQGWHALHVVAYINNTELADIAPDAPPGDYGKPGSQGEGGYLIVRNSWGPCAGDGGYLYLPYRWLKPGLFVTSAVAIAPGDLTPWMVEQ